MDINDYPDNKEIEETRKAISELEQSRSWEEIVYAKSDLQAMLTKRDEWAKENGIN